MVRVAKSLRELPIEWIATADLTPHPRNYRQHPEAQLAHLEKLVREFGFFKNIVIARDSANTILAGHGIAEVAVRVGAPKVPCKRLNVAPNSAAALRALAGDNETPLLADDNDRLLSEILREISGSDGIEGLLGTGYDAETLSNLVFVTRPASEIGDFDAAAAWTGLPGYESDPDLAGPKLVVQFDDDKGREDFLAKVGIDTIAKKTNGTWSARWPARAKEDLASLRFTEDDE